MLNEACCLCFFTAAVLCSRPHLLPTTHIQCNTQSTATRVLRNTDAPPASPTMTSSRNWHSQWATSRRHAGWPTSNSRGVTKMPNIYVYRGRNAMASSWQSTADGAHIEVAGCKRTVSRKLKLLETSFLGVRVASAKCSAHVTKTATAVDLHQSPLRSHKYSTHDSNARSQMFDQPKSPRPMLSANGNVNCNRHILPDYFVTFPQELHLKAGLNELNIQSVPRSKHSDSVIKTSQSMLYREIIAVCSEIHTKHINTLRGQNGEFVVVKHGGTWL
jgi:hypothetical protein